MRVKGSSKRGGDGAATMITSQQSHQRSGASKGASTGASKAKLDKQRGNAQTGQVKRTNTTTKNQNELATANSKT